MAHAGPQPCLGYLVIRLWIDSEPSTTVYQAYRRLANLLVYCGRDGTRTRNLTFTTLLYHVGLPTYSYSSVFEKPAGLADGRC